MKKKVQILYEVCGIGNGHANRQIPIIEYYARQGAQIIIFSHDNGLLTLSARFGKSPRIKILPVAVPFVAGNNAGIDWGTTANSPYNQGLDYTLNYRALDFVTKNMPNPNLVITDNGPISAAYAYQKNLPMVVINQQNKFLCGEFPLVMNGHTPLEEIERLQLFFPRAHRLACSFFQFKRYSDLYTDVVVVPPTYKPEILKMKRMARQNPSHILMYISPAREIGIDMLDLGNLLSEVGSQFNVIFHIFAQEFNAALLSAHFQKSPNIHAYRIGDQAFLDVMSYCRGIITPAGHTILSEAMMRNIPVYALSVGPFEQQINAEVIHKSKFGLGEATLSLDGLNRFVTNLDAYAENIRQDKRNERNPVLVKGNGVVAIVQYIEHTFGLFV
jgi:uncharacterized protein (TIGR00661 family)